MELDTPFAELGVGQTAFEDDSPFFALGLKSSNATDLILRLNQNFDMSLNVTQIFETPTPKTLRAKIVDLSGMDASHV